MDTDNVISVDPGLSEEFVSFEEFCVENAGRELSYFEMVTRNPLEMDSVTLAFTMKHMLRFSRDLLDLLLKSLDGGSPPELPVILGIKGIQLDKTHASSLRDVIFAFRACADPDTSCKLVRALQLMTITRERQKVSLNLTESYNPPDEGWTSEDYGDDENVMAAIQSIEDTHWTETEER